LPWNLAFPVATIFAGNGFVLASSFSRLPSIRDRVHASPTELAFVLVALGAGSIIGMPCAARLVERFSSQMVSRLATCISLTSWAALPLIANSVVQLGILLFVTGVGAGAGGVAMNVQGNLVEQRYQKVLMPLWHGLFSLGAVAGALTGALGALREIPVAWQLPLVSAAMFFPMWFATKGYLSDPQPNPQDPSIVASKEPIFDEFQA
jgi:predicted MFS family arabinose efflux permease